MTGAGAGEEGIRFYFSFRSPYAWLAAERLDEELGALGVPIERIPIYPIPGAFPNDPNAVREKIVHLVQDVRRLTRERGLSVRFPSAAEADWALPHGAYRVAEAEDEAAGGRFMLEVFRKRFGEGLDVGDEAVVADAATRAGLDPQTILDGARDAGLRADVAGAWERARVRDGVFGVPTFVYSGEIFWGQDRMHHVRAAVEAAARGGAA